MLLGVGAMMRLLRDCEVGGDGGLWVLGMLYWDGIGMGCV